jgi:hypothetical protein
MSRVFELQYDNQSIIINAKQTPDKPLTIDHFEGATISRYLDPVHRSPRLQCLVAVLLRLHVANLHSKSVITPSKPCHTPLNAHPRWVAVLEQLALSQVLRIGLLVFLRRIIVGCQ